MPEQKKKKKVWTLIIDFTTYTQQLFVGIQFLPFSLLCANMSSSALMLYSFNHPLRCFSYNFVYNIIFIFTPWMFLPLVLANGFHWNLSDSMSPQVSRTLLSILTLLKNVVVWMVSIRPPTLKSSSTFNNPLIPYQKHQSRLVTLSPSYSISFQFPSKIEVFLLIFKFFQFYSVVSWDSKIYKSSFLLLIILRSGLLVKSKWSVFISKSHWSLCELFSRTNLRLCRYHLFVWSNLNLLLIFQCITLPTQLCLGLLC